MAVRKQSSSPTTYAPTVQGDVNLNPGEREHIPASTVTTTSVEEPETIDSTGELPELPTTPGQDESGPARCANPEQLGDGSPSLRLQTNRPLVFIRDALPGFTKDAIWKWILEGFERWGAVCDIVARRIMDLSEAGPNDYVQLVTVADLGGGGVLADQYLPSPGLKQLRMRINSRIRWVATDGPMQSGTIDPIRTLCHETGHFLGFSHMPVGAPPDLMEPYVSNTIIRPTMDESKIATSWFGPPLTTPVPPIPPVPPSNRVTELENTIKGMIALGNKGLTGG